jgi:aryl sulfotransferase
MDLRVPPKEVKLPAVEEQTHRRFVKTHLPVDALVFSEKAKYIFIGRDGRDVVWSLYNHHLNANTAWYDALNNTPGRIGPEIELPCSSISQYFDDWLEKDGFPFWSLWDNARTWWEIHNLPNVHMVHFANLKSDMPGEIRRIAEFIGTPIEESKWENILKHCSFDYMRANATKSVPLGGAFWDGGAQTFIHKGTNGRWLDVLSAKQVLNYEQRAESELGPDCAHWFATGEFR